MLQFGKTRAGPLPTLIAKAVIYRVRSTGQQGLRLAVLRYAASWRIFPD